MNVNEDILLMKKFREEPKEVKEVKERVIFQAAPRQDTPPKDDEHQDTQHPFHKYGKTGLLVFVWIIMVFFLTRTPEKKIEKRQLSIPIDDPRIYNFPSLPGGSRINVTLEGAFLPEVLEQYQRRQTLLNRRKLSGDSNSIEKEKEKDNYLRIYLRTATKHRQLTQQRIYAIQNPSDFDFSNSTRLPIMFDIGEDYLELLEDGEQIQLVIESNFTKTPLDMKQEMPLIFSYDVDPINKQIGVIFAAFVLIFLYALIIWEVSMVKCLLFP